MTTPIRIGLLRLVDSAPVVVAEARGLFEDLGVAVALSVEPSWSNCADKLAYGLLDAAVMLPPLALAAAMGLRGPPAPIIVPMGLTQGGNSIVLAHAAWSDGPAKGLQMADWLRAQPKPPRLAVVHRFSTHNLLLRYWLALAGIDPETEIETVVVPPEQVVGALAEGRIAGFCAGAPWGDVAESVGAGRILLGTSAIWPFHPEKCLAVHAPWAERNPAALQALLRALLQAQVICDQAEEADDVAALLAQPDGLALPQIATRAALPCGGGTEQIHFHAAGAWFPAVAHAEWFLTQVRRWNWFGPEISIKQVAARVYRPDLLSEAACDEALAAVPRVLERAWISPGAT